MNKVENLQDGVTAFDNEEFSKSYDLLLPLAEEGNATAQCYIASMYQGGLGIPLDSNKAIEWYLKSAEQSVKEGHVSGTAYNNLAGIYSVGMPGVSANPDLAKEYWKRAEELGFEMIPKKE